MTPTTRPRRRKAEKPSAPEAPVTIGSVPLLGTKTVHPEVGLGLWNRGRWSADDEGRVEATAEHAFQRGVRWFDTAEVYGAGRSERSLSAVLAHHPESEPPIFVVSKVSWEHLRPLQIRAAIQGTLERLDRPSVDLYLVHAPDARVPIGETMQALAVLADSGKVGSIGVSNFSVPELEAAQAALAPRPIVVNQVRYNLLEREDGDAIQEHCARHGIWIEAYSPLCHGMLAGRFLETGNVPAATRRAVRRFDPEHLDATLVQARELQALADRSGVPLAAIALHWLRTRRALPVFGATRAEQVDANLAAWATKVPASVIEEADALTRAARA